MFQSSTYLDFLKNVVGVHGNAPGYPNQFKRDYPGHFPGPETIPDNLDIFPEPQYHIPRTDRVSNDAHLYGTNVMVSDVPFDYIGMEVSNRNLAWAGFAAIVVGIALFI